MKHMYKEGERVYFVPSMSVYSEQGEYEVVRLMPLSTDAPSYEIKSRFTRYSRIAKEYELKRA